MSSLAASGRLQRRAFRLCSLLLCCLALPANAQARDGQEQRVHSATSELMSVPPGAVVHVSPPAEPTRVKLSTYLVELSDVDPPSKAFPSYKAEIFLDVSWSDPRLSFDPSETAGRAKVFQDSTAEAELREIWSPNLHIANEQGTRRTDARTLIISPTGQVEYTERFEATLHAEVNLRRFPFDEQRFQVQVQSFNWDESDVVFEPYPERTGFDSDVHTLEWTVLDVGSRIASSKEVRSSRKFSSYVFEIHVERESGYYLWKLVLPLLMIVTFSWSTFWMTGEAATTRLQRSFVALLTLVAFYQVVAANLPRISYLTFLDGVAFLAFTSVGLTLLHTILFHRASHRGDTATTEKLDRLAQRVIPAGFVAGFLVLWFVFHG